MRAFARVLCPDGSVRDLYPGDIIGRMWTAALQLDDGRISEAHALVSLRGGDLKLLALRGLLAIDRKPVQEVVLAPGVDVRLAKGQHLQVIEVELPAGVLAVEGEGLRRQPLSASVCSLHTAPRRLLVRGFERGAAAHLWSTEDAWRLQIPGEPPRSLAAGDRWVLDGRAFQVVEVALARAGHDETRLKGRLHPPLRIVAQYDTVQLHREGATPLVLNGLPARIVSELVSFDGPASWEAVAGELWRGEDDRYALRRKWDVNLARLRRKLRDARVRPDLVKADGSGHFELLLYDGDTVEDRT